jgi:hypothetical protein
MTSYRFPALRADGSCSVAIRLRLPAMAQQELEDYVARWMREKAEQGINISDDLVTEPHIVIRGEDTVDIVVEGKANSLRWKDWFVDLTVHLPPMAKEARECLYDLVADRAQPRFRD